jgi:hypothetical protein
VTAGLVEGRFDGRSAFRDALRGAFRAAAKDGWRELVLADHSFEDWPLNEQAAADDLHAWARQGGRLTLLAARYDTLQRLHARFVDWRVTWDHLVSARACRGADAADLPGALWSPGWMVQRLDPVRSVFVCSDDADRRVRLRESLDEWLRRSSAAFPASTLGL